jgi:hypothetical protein
MVFIFFMLVGVVASIYVLMMRILRPKAVGRFVVVIPATATSEDVASLLYAARLRVGLMGDIQHGSIIALDCGMNERQRIQCEALCAELDHTVLVNLRELPKELGVNECEAAMPEQSND